MPLLSRILLLLPLLVPAFAQAQELTPRAYWPTPQGTRVGTVGLLHTDGDVVPDPTLPLTGVDSSISSMFFGYLHTTSLWGRTANIVVEGAYGSGDTKVDLDPGLGLGDTFKREYQGVADLGFTFAVNLLGAPAMNREEFAALRRNPHPILGASVKVVAPTGRYDEERVVNVGANRWAGKLELGYIQPLSPKWLLEVELGTWFFSDNDDFLGNKTREQDPITALDVHLVHRFAPGFWASVDWNAYKGGRSKIDGRKLDDLQRDSRIGATLVFPFAQRNAIKFSYTIGSLNDTDEDFDIYQVSYTRIF